MQKEKKDITKHRYNLASAPSRLFARALDIILLVTILVGIFFSIFWNETNFDFPNWKFFIFCLVVFVLFFIYFVLLPFFSGGYTLFSWIFKIRIYSTNLKTITTRKWLKNLDFVFFVQLLIREVLSFGLMTIMILLLGIMIFIVPIDVKQYLQNILKLESTNISESNPIQIIFSTFFSIIALIDVLLIFNVILFSGKRTFTDHISNTVVIKMIDVIGDKDPTMPLNYKVKKEKVKYNLPGEINVDDIFNEDN